MGGVGGPWAHNKYGKQYPAFNGKRNVHSLLAEHDYHGYDAAAAKRARFKTTTTATTTPVAAVDAGGQANQSQTPPAPVVVAAERLAAAHRQPVVLRISEEL